MKFTLDPRLVGNGDVIAELSLSSVIFANNKLFPWLILVPRRPDIREIIDLNDAEQKILFDEIVLASKVVKEVFGPDKLNVAALGNVVAQLHVHVIGRFENDVAWPDPVFGKGKEPYDAAVYAELKQKLRSLIAS